MLTPMCDICGELVGAAQLNTIIEGSGPRAARKMVCKDEEVCLDRLRRQEAKRDEWA